MNVTSRAQQKILMALTLIWLAGRVERRISLCQIAHGQIVATQEQARVAADIPPLKGEFLQRLLRQRLTAREITAPIQQGAAPGGDFTLQPGSDLRRESGEQRLNPIE